MYKQVQNVIIPAKICPTLTTGYREQANAASIPPHAGRPNSFSFSYFFFQYKQAMNL